MQLLGCAIPACLYLVYVLHLVSRAQADEREKKRIVNQIKQNMDERNKHQNNNHADNTPPAGKKSKRHRFLGGSKLLYKI